MKFLLLFLFSFIAAVPMAYPTFGMGLFTQQLGEPATKFIQAVKTQLGDGGSINVVKSAENAVKFTVKGTDGAVKTIKLNKDGLAGLERLTANSRTAAAAHKEAVEELNAAVLRNADDATMNYLNALVTKSATEAQQAQNAYSQFLEKAVNGENINRGLTKLLASEARLTTGQIGAIAAGAIGVGVVGGVAGAGIQKGIDDSNMG